MTDQQLIHKANGRRDFLKALSLITACAIIENPLELVSKPESIVKAKWLKITPELEQDIKVLKMLIRHTGLKLSDNDPNWESKTNIQIGYDGDDFARNRKTLVLTYVS